MPRQIKVAAIQMDANPAPTAERLQRAEALVKAAAQDGAQLVTLPEIFNTGYAYSPLNHHLAEPLSGPTPTWMRQTAARHNIHLAGSLMLLDHDDVYNSLLLFAPSGQMWRYDKQYPWAWERTYFRDGNRIVVADTELGDLGFMVCWDVAHRDLWKRYAGRVDMMVITSCPPNPDANYLMPNGDTLTLDDFGAAIGPLREDGAKVFGAMINEQTSWLGVPAVNTVGTGRIRTALPNGFATLMSLLPMSPRLARYLPRANRVELETDMVAGCKVVAASGRPITELPAAAGEKYTIATVTIQDKKPQPHTPQPPSTVSQMSYVISDVVLPFLSIPYYRRGLRKAHGQQMAPTDTTTSRWAILLAGVGFVGFLFGRLWRKR